MIVRKCFHYIGAGFFAFFDHCEKESRSLCADLDFTIGGLFARIAGLE